ncbi:MAG: mechanosensitive ion channel domain-containing protein [Halobacteriaceae archaeon]
MVDWEALLETDAPYVVALGVLLVGLALGLLVRRVVRRTLEAAGVPDVVQGTSFERWAQRMGFSTAGVFAELAAWFVYGTAVLLALRVAELMPTATFWYRLTSFLPSLFLAVVVLGVGVLLADKAALVTQEWVSGVKLPEVSVLPRLVKWSVLYVAALVALSQVGAATGALVVLLGVYAAAVLLALGLALRDVLPAVAAGVYVILHEPYSIGDTIAVADHEGVVQEIDVYVTRIEDDGREYVVPNHLVLREGVVRVL